MKKGIKILLIILSILIICGVSIFIINKEKIYEKKDIDKYKEYLSELKNNSDVHSKLFIFPDEINKDNVEEFQYLKKDGLFDGSYLFYIIVKYDEKEYNKEIDRLKKIKRIFNGFDKFILYTEELKYHTYITICDGMDTFEYALLDDNNKKIIYVFRQLFNSNNNLKDDYLLKYKVPNDKKDKNSIGFNMYYFYDEFGVGYMEGYENK